MVLENTINSILSTYALTRAEQELKWIEQEGINHLFYADKKYPMRLKQCEDAPLNLFYKGNIDWEKDKFISMLILLKQLRPMDVCFLII